MFQKLIDNAVEQSKINIRVNEGDYTGEDGLLYCGKCNTKKQAEIEVFGEKRRPFCLCKCEEEKRDREEAERKRAELVYRLRRECFGDNKKLYNCTFANDDMTNAKITTAMQKYVANFKELKKQGKGLLLHGSCGTGKTFAACEVANALIEMGYPVFVTNFAEIINTLQNTFEKQEYIDSFNRYALLVIDDLGIERNTEFAKEQVYNVIDERIKSGLPMIITTNLTLDKITTTDDISYMRIYERILERCMPIEVEGQNRRMNAARQSYSDMKELLGL